MLFKIYLLLLSYSLELMNPLSNTFLLVESYLVSNNSAKIGLSASSGSNVCFELVAGSKEIIFTITFPVMALPENDEE